MSDGAAAADAALSHAPKFAVFFPTSCAFKESKWRPFILKPLPSPLMKPVLVFVNPKSGGNQVPTLDH